jgi:predicted NBD/HSP70 family sugar kinase
MNTFTEELNSVVDIRKNRLRRTLLTTLYQSGNTSINILSKLFHTSIPSATTIINDMVKEGWLVDAGTVQAKAGRPPALYGLNPVHYYTIVVDINLKETTLNLLDLQNTILETRVIDLSLVNEFTFLTAIIREIRKFMQEQNLTHQKVWGIGIAMPGLINTQSGVNQTYDKLSSPTGSLTSVVMNELHIPAYLINDTQATTIGEHRFGLAKGKSHVLTINIDWGIGLGILINGEVFNGANGFAGELGHIQVKPDGILCHCAKIGCLDTVSSAIALIRQAKEGMQAGKTTILSKYVTNIDDLTTQHIIKAVLAGDEFCIDLVGIVGAELGRGLATAVHLFNPEIIIVTGVLAETGEFISNPMELAINKYCLSDFKNSLTFCISQLGNKARLLGTQAFLFEKLVTREFGY